MYDASSTNADGRSMRDRCCDGWDGTRCDICRTVDACPTTYDGSGRAHEVSSLLVVLLRSGYVRLVVSTTSEPERWLRPPRALGAPHARATRAPRRPHAPHLRTGTLFPASRCPLTCRPSNSRVKAVNCTSNSLVAETEEEATMGKRFSCSCGGGKVRGWGRMSGQTG